MLFNFKVKLAGALDARNINCNFALIYNNLTYKLTGALHYCLLLLAWSNYTVRFNIMTISYLGVRT